MEVWKIIFLSKLVICRFHVNLEGVPFLWRDLMYTKGKAAQLEPSQHVYVLSQFFHHATMES